MFTKDAPRTKFPEKEELWSNRNLTGALLDRVNKGALGIGDSLLLVRQTVDCTGTWASVSQWKEASAAAPVVQSGGRW